MKPLLALILISLEFTCLSFAADTGKEAPALTSEGQSIVNNSKNPAVSA